MVNPVLKCQNRPDHAVFLLKSFEILHKCTMKYYIEVPLCEEELKSNIPETQIPEWQCVILEE